MMEELYFDCNNMQFGTLTFNCDAQGKIGSPKTALIFGVAGQDGYYLSHELKNEGYNVVGVKRRTSQDNTSHLEDIKVVEGDVTDMASILSLILEHKPTHIFNLAAQSHVRTSFDQPIYTAQVTAIGCLNILECIRQHDPSIRFYQASSSEMFGKETSLRLDDHYVGRDVSGKKVFQDLKEYKSGNYEKYYIQRDHMVSQCQDEYTNMVPESPYSIAKLAAYHYTRLYRESYGIFAANGILFNHESSMRGEKFVTQKIAKYVAEVYKFAKENNRSVNEYCFSQFVSCNTHVMLGDTCTSSLILPKLKLGNLDASRDWGYAGDYTRAMRLILEHEEPDDFVVATGETHTVKEFVDAAFKYIGIEDWSGFVTTDISLLRPSEVPFLRGNADKAEQELGWKPDVNFEELVAMMVSHQIGHSVEAK